MLFKDIKNFQNVSHAYAIINNMSQHLLNKFDEIIKYFRSSIEKYNKLYTNEVGFKGTYGHKQMEIDTQ